jgi:hypothetical protein
MKYENGKTLKIEHHKQQKKCWTLGQSDLQTERKRNKRKREERE